MKKTLDGLTLLRGAFALYVLIFHIDIRSKIDAGQWLGTAIGNGAISMTFFFLLSGFVLAYSYGEKEIDYSDFIKRRLLRIYPAYIFLGVVTLPILFTMRPAEAAASFFLFITATQAWVYQSLGSWGFSGSWTVSVEVFFYLLFPLALPIVKKYTIESLLIAFAIGAVLIPISEIYQIGYSPIRSIYYSGPMYRLPEFIVGIALGLLFKSGYRISPFYLLAALPALAYAALQGSNYGFMAYNFAVIPALSIIILFAATADIKKTKLSAPFIYFGNISYSFYLMQLAAFMYLDNHIRGMSFSDNKLEWLCFVALIFALAVICHELTEGGVRKRIDLLFRIKVSHPH